MPPYCELCGHYHTSDDECQSQPRLIPVRKLIGLKREIYHMLGQIDKVPFDPKIDDGARGAYESVLIKINEIL